MDGNLAIYRYLRCDKSRLYIALSVNQYLEERILADFNFSVNQSIDLIPFKGSLIKQKLTLLNKTNEEYVFKIDDPYTADDGETITYKRDVGIKTIDPEYGISLSLINYQLQ